METNVTNVPILMESESAMRGSKCGIGIFSRTVCVWREEGRDFIVTVRFLFIMAKLVAI